jgi:hypothetical protein
VISRTISTIRITRIYTALQLCVKERQRAAILDTDNVNLTMDKMYISVGTKLTTITSSELLLYLLSPGSG